jgi:hypothetical protein
VVCKGHSSRWPFRGAFQRLPGRGAIRRGLSGLSSSWSIRGGFKVACQGPRPGGLSGALFKMACQDRGPIQGHPFWCPIKMACQEPCSKVVCQKRASALESVRDPTLKLVCQGPDLHTGCRGPSHYNGITFNFDHSSNLNIF